MPRIETPAPHSYEARGFAFPVLMRPLNRVGTYHWVDFSLVVILRNSCCQG